MFDEQPDANAHGECALEIHKLRKALIDLSGATTELLKVAPKPRLMLDQYGIELQRVLMATLEATIVLNPEQQ